eukprot:gene12607-5128_t
MGDSGAAALPRAVVSEWCERGYGFLARAGEYDLYVHASARCNVDWTPKRGDVVEYAVGTGSDGRPKATAIKYVETGAAVPDGKGRLPQQGNMSQQGAMTEGRVTRSNKKFTIVEDAQGESAYAPAGTKGHPSSLLGGGAPTMMGGGSLAMLPGGMMPGTMMPGMTMGGTGGAMMPGWMPGMMMGGTGMPGMMGGPMMCSAAVTSEQQADAEGALAVMNACRVRMNTSAAAVMAQASTSAMMTMMGGK